MMAKEEKKAPKLRFNGYTNDWERKKLGNVAENLSYGLNLPSTNYDGNNIYLRITDIDDESHTLNRDNLTSPNLRKFNKNILDYKLTENDIVFARTGASVGKTYVYTPTDGNIYFAGFLVRAKFKSSILANFVFYTTLTSKYLNYVKVTSQRSGQPGVNAKEYGNFAISITDSTEQFRIISLLKKLDSTINLHERKCEELALIKKALLQKLFPKKDEFKPEVRYKNFSDAWEQRKLNNFLETSKLKNLNHKFKKEDILSVSGDYGIVNQMEFQGRSFAGASLKNYRVVEKQNVVYTKSPLKANPYGIIKANKGNKGIVSTLYAVYKTKGDVSANFVEYYFANNYRLNAYLKPIVNKGAKNTILISDDNAINGKVIFPLDHVEQKKIGAFLADFDSLITLHQGKLEKLKKMKKFLLQNMFI